MNSRLPGPRLDLLHGWGEVKRSTGGHERFALHAGAELGQNPIEVRDRPGMQVRVVQRLTLLRIGDQVDDAWRGKPANWIGGVLLGDGIGSELEALSTRQRQEDW